MSLKENLFVWDKILKNTKPFKSQQKKKLEELVKIVKKLKKTYLTKQNLLSVQDLWQPQYKILLVILLKKFMKLDLSQTIK